MGIRSHICGSNDDKVLNPYITVFTFMAWNSDFCLVLQDLVFNMKTSFTTYGVRLRFTLNISIAKLCRFFYI